MIPFLLFKERKAKEANEKAEAERQRRSSIVTLNVGLLKTNHSPTTSGGVNAFRLYQEEQAKSSEDRISYFKKQMMDRRGAITQTAVVFSTKGLEVCEETASEDDDESDEEWET